MKRMRDDAGNNCDHRLIPFVQSHDETSTFCERRDLIRRNSDDVLME